MCGNITTVEAGFFGWIVSPTNPTQEANNPTSRDCTLQLTGLPAYSWVDFKVESANLSGSCGVNFVEIDQEPKHLCKEGKKIRRYYANTNSSIAIRFVLQQRHYFKIRYRGKYFM